MESSRSQSIYEFRDYREYLKSALPVRGPSRGARNRLAEALRCQKGFVSQVLSGLAHFSLEHGTKIAEFLKLDSNEGEFFLLLLHLGRAGSKDLEKFYDKRIKAILEARRQIKERVRGRSDLNASEQMTYYSSWHFTAVHMCLLIPDLRTKRAMSAFLGIQPGAVSRVLDFLLNCGLAHQKGDEFISGSARLHLPADSPLVAKHHTNWRMRAIESLDHVRESDLHYSLVMSVSKEAAEEIRSTLLKAIQETEPILKEAEDKTVYALNMDLFCLER